MYFCYCSVRRYRFSQSALFICGSNKVSIKFVCFQNLSSRVSLNSPRQKKQKASNQTLALSINFVGMDSSNSYRESGILNFYLSLSLRKNTSDISKKIYLDLWYILLDYFMARMSYFKSTSHISHKIILVIQQVYIFVYDNCFSLWSTKLKMEIRNVSLFLDFFFTQIWYIKFIFVVLVLKN